ncbi:MAG: hypothetical protein VYD44_01335, partial [Candidatus Thermoplasmatota archaeon]|nr:hypothetical protein [Candidatus Thermoplasmatota archaeon]
TNGSLPGDVGAGGLQSNPWGAPMQQLTGDPHTMARQTAFSVPQPVEKTGVRWGQFLLGFFIPVVIVVTLSFVDGLVNRNYEYGDPWRTEMLEVSSSDNQTYEFTLAPNGTERVQHFYIEAEHQGERFTIYMDQWTIDEDSIWQMNQSSDETSRIGTYHHQNATAYFQLAGVQAGTLEVVVEYYDDGGEYDEPPAQAAIDFVCCLLPFAYLASIIAAFATGRKALGAGLMSASLLIILPLLFLIIALSAMP